jgi:type 1 glutamine amidotransferase
LSHSERVLAELGKAAGFDVECTKDGRVFDRDLDAYDALVFYSCGDMFQPSVRKAPPMSPAGRQRLLDAVAAGKPLVGLHSACYWGPDSGPDDPYLAMVGGRFVAHGAQQEAAMKVVSPGFPGSEGLGGSFRLLDEWYALKDFADDLHVVLVQQTQGMQGAMYQRPAFPATWARMHGKGRVFFSSMGHREDAWTNRSFQQVLLGGLAWALGNVDADITPNLHRVTPKAEQLHN